MKDKSDGSEVRFAWMMAEAEQRLLDFVGALIVEAARTHSRLSQFQVALWLARVAVGR